MQHGNSSLGIARFRLCSYVYDTESGLYYLQSRYYDPEIGRFINADVFTSTGQGLLGNNMFAYCRNNPVCRKDASGTDDICVTNETTEDGNPFNDLGFSGYGGGGGGSGSSICYSPGASYYYGVDFSTSTYSSLTHGGIYNNGYTFYSGNAAAPAVCFVAGTLVQTEDGTIPIENISAGDRVWAWDEETGDIALKEVVETYINESSDLIHVFVNGEEIVTTPFHPFYSPVKGWTDAVKLRAGDVLVLVDGEYVVVEKVQHELLEEPVAVYNFQVEDYHTYYVADAGVLVHNLCDGKITGYTKHGIHQASTRDGVGVKPSAILETVRNPDKIVMQDEGKIKYVGKQAVVVTNSSGRIITTYAKGSEFTRVGQ